jgi:hypothetical protein
MYMYGNLDETMGLPHGFEVPGKKKIRFMDYHLLPGLDVFESGLAANGI